MAIEGVPGFLRYRVINRITGLEITSDLPHLHQSNWTVMAMQPGNPGSSAMGAFSIPLHAPGSDRFAAAKVIYDQLLGINANPGYWLRVEAYRSDTGLSAGGAPAFAGFVLGINANYGEGQNDFTLTGVTDVGLANYSRPFPGEYLYLNYGSGSATSASYRQAKHYFAANEAGWTDTFNPFTVGNYNATSLPATTAGTWSGTTDDGINVASDATGSGAVLIAKTGAAAGDIAHRQFVEISGRILPSADNTNAGQTGVGLTGNNGNVNNGILALIRTHKNAGTGRWDVDAFIQQWNAGVSTNVATSNSILTSADDPEGYVPFTITLSLTGNNQITAQMTVNGSVVGTVPGPTTTFDPGVTTCYPFLYFGAPTSGSATTYLGNLIQQVRFSEDGNAGVAVFKPGTIGSPTHSLPLNSEPGPTFLEVWTRAATRENFYWRYTPQTYASPTRTIGSVDFAADPGTDRTASVVFSRSIGNLLSVQMSGNADQFAAGTSTAGPASSDGNGLSYWRDIPSITNYGVIDDQTLNVIAPNWTELRAAARRIVSNKTALLASGAKRIRVLRDPSTADQWRELDKVTIHDPELGINYLSARVVGYAFTEGDPTQTIWLDQFGVGDPTISWRRTQQAIFQMAKTFKTR